MGRDEDTWTSLFYTAAFGAIILSLIVPFFWLKPNPLAAVLMMILGSIGALAHFCLFRAYMAAEASVIAPFSYAGLLFATFWGMLIFCRISGRVYVPRRAFDCICGDLCLVPGNADHAKK